MVYGPRREALRLGPGGAYAEERDEGRLGERRVLAGRLAQLGGGRGGVQHVVVDLEGEADVRAVAAQRLARCGRSPGREAADHRRRGDESARLAPVHVRELAHGEAPPLGLQVERLPANHAARPRRAEQLEGDRPPPRPAARPLPRPPHRLPRTRAWGATACPPRAGCSGSRRARAPATSGRRACPTPRGPRLPGGVRPGGRPRGRGQRSRSSTLRLPAWSVRTCLTLTSAAVSRSRASRRRSTPSSNSFSAWSRSRSCPSSCRTIASSRSSWAAKLNGSGARAITPPRRGRRRYRPSPAAGTRARAGIGPRA